MSKEVSLKTAEGELIPKLKPQAYPIIEECLYGTSLLDPEGAQDCLSPSGDSRPSGLMVSVHLLPAVLLLLVIYLIYSIETKTLAVVAHSL